MTSAPERSADRSPLRIALFGASGRMGQAIAEAIAQQHERVCLSGACVSATSAALGQSLAQLHGLPAAAGGDVIALGDPREVLGRAHVAIDFSLPDATPVHAAACAAARCPLVSGVTGLDEPATAALRQAAQDIPVLHSRNMSLGINLLALALRTLAGHLPAAHYDAEIHEFHHRAKRDAPSGTALMLGEVIAAARGDALRGDADRGGVRGAGEVGFAVSRGGDVAGEHTVTFAGEGERLELVHRAGGRQGFARGSLLAARWLAGQVPGHYDMSDVFEL